MAGAIVAGSSTHWVQENGLLSMAGAVVAGAEDLKSITKYYSAMPCDVQSTTLFSQILHPRTIPGIFRLERSRSIPICCCPANGGWA